MDRKLDGVRIGVVGMGTTGRELATTFAEAGADVRIGAAAVADCDVVIEAVPEDLDTKRRVLLELAAVCGPDAIVVVTSLVLPLTAIVAGTTWEDRCCGLRYVGPLSGRKLVQLASLPGNGDAVHRISGLCKAVGKRVQVCADPDIVDVPTALLFRTLNEAALLYDRGYAGAADIDAAMRLGCGWPVGPLAMLDIIGLDCAVNVLDVLVERTGRDVFVAAPVLRRMVSAGLLGEKSGVGFHSHPDTSAPGDSASTVDVPVRRVGVLGSGTMAVGISATVAASGIPAVLVARTADKAAAAIDAVREQVEPAAPVTGSDSIADLADCDVVIEAVVEDLAVKRALLAELDTVCAPGTVLATTTSSLPVIDCATATTRPQDVIGLHFFNPAPAMPLVELVRSELTGARAERVARALCRRLAKHVVTCPDRAGFIVNRLLFPMLNDAVVAVDAGQVSCDVLDAVLRSGVGLPMGPIRLLDVVGADVALSVQESLCREFGAAELTPAPALRALVASGHLGRKAACSVRTHPALAPRTAA